MTKAELARIAAWRLRIMQHAGGEPRQVARTCRYFGISRTAFYRWKQRFDEFGEACLADRPRTPHRSPRATPPSVVSKILYLRQNYHFGAGRIAAYDMIAVALYSLTPSTADSAVQSFWQCRP